MILRKTKRIKELQRELERVRGLVDKEPRRLYDHDIKAMREQRKHV